MDPVSQSPNPASSASAGGAARGLPALAAGIDRLIGTVCRWTLYATLTVVFLILSINVGLRYAAGTSLSWASELPELLFPWMIMAGVVLAAQHGSHIAVVILTQRLPAALRRWVLGLGSLIVVGLYADLAWIAWPLMEIAGDERTPILHVPGSVSVASLLIGFLMLCTVTLIRLPKVWAMTPANDDHEGERA